MIPSRSVPLLIAAVALVSCGGSDDPDDAASTITTTEPTPSTTPPSTPTTEPTPSTTPPSTPTTEPTPSTTPPSTGTATTTSNPPETTMTIPSGIPIVEQAIADLAARLDVDPTTIEVVSVEEVDWPDGSIGCPAPDMVYTQAIVNGTRIVLRIDGTDYSYHQGGARSLFFCPPERVVLP